MQLSHNISIFEYQKGNAVPTDIARNVLHHGVGLFNYRTMEKEIWKDIEGYEGFYQVSNKGDVRSFYKRMGGRKMKKLMKTTGYYMVILYKDGVQKNKPIHQLVAEAFIPNPKNKPHINHKDGNRLNNEVPNLEWVTPKENARHAVETGALDMKGEKHHNAILKRNEVKKIRELYKTGEFTQKELGIIFDTSRSNIAAIVRNERWLHI